MKYMMIAFLFVVIGLPVWSGGASEEGAIEFLQWWQLEMASGSFERVISDFESANPEITVTPINLPYPDVQDQINVGAAGGQLPDVIGIDPPRINNFIKQNAVEPLDVCIQQEGINVDDLAGVKKIDGNYWMLPVVSFIYPLYYNVDLFNAAGLSDPPRDQEEFVEYARILTKPDQNQYGWVLPLSLQLPNGVSNDIFPWVWTGGDTVMRNDRPNLNSQPVIRALSLVDRLFQEGSMSPGTLTKKEPEKVEEFATGRVAMMISSTAHINLLRQRDPNLNFDIAPIPGPKGYNGPPASRVVGWAIGIAKSSQNKEAACKLIAHIIEQQTNGFVSSSANAFPGNLNAEPDFVIGDPLYSKAFDIFTQAQLRAELVGAPKTTELERLFAEEMHAMLGGDQSPAQAAAAAQESWEAVFADN